MFKRKRSSRQFVQDLLKSKEPPSKRKRIMWKTFIAEPWPPRIRKHRGKSG